MSTQYETRKLPKKTIYLIALLILLGILSIFGVSYFKQLKTQNILKHLGYTNPVNLTVYNISDVQDDSNNTKGELTKLKFHNENQECFGFILKNKKTGQYRQDIDCK